jgi:hypothetical protein
MDNLLKPEQKSTIRMLNDLSNQYGTKAAIEALKLAIEKDSVNKADATILAARITGYGIDTPPEPGPSLTVYDQAFFPPKEEKQEKKVVV